MRPVLGIPRGMFFYKYYPLWKSYFNHLEIDILTSSTTDNKTIEDGENNCLDEVCLPIKVFVGHVINIKDKVDALFIPRYTSIAKREYVCSQFRALPEIVRSSVKELPPIIDVEINLSKDKDNSAVAAIQIAEQLGISFYKAVRAYNRALKSYKAFKTNVKRQQLSYKVIDEKNILQFLNTKYNILLLGHIYNTNDIYLNNNIVKKLEDHRCRVLTIDMFNKENYKNNIKQIQQQYYWQYGSYIIASMRQIIAKNKIDGIIYLGSYNCGVDSFVSYIVERQLSNENSTPFTSFILNNKSSVLAFNTRLEAFLNLVEWRCNNENNISTNG